MPPVTKAGGQQFRKDVEFVAKEDDEQVAAGIVMVPDKVDLQNDFARESTIREFADQFEAFVDAGEAGGGIMHAVFPDDWMGLERNEVLDEATEIGGTEAPAGAWVQEWRVKNADLWDLINDGVLEGYSIGAVQVGWDGPFEQSELDGVDVPDKIGEDEAVWELIDGLIREVSAVDIPAVPDAQILETKADAEKRLGDYLGDPDGFLEEALERGHSEAEAERLWEVLNEAASVEGADSPGKESLFHRIGKAAVDTFLGNGDTDADSEKASGAAKEGRTLSKANRDSAMAAVDANLDILEDAGVDHGMTRFTDREDTSFDLTEHEARSWPNPDGEDEGEGADVSPVNNAAGSDTPDDSTDMSDNTDDDPMADAPEWAKALNDRIDDLEDSEKDAAGDADDPMADAPKWAKGLAERVDEIEEKAKEAAGGIEGEEKPEWAKELEARIDTISQQSGVSTQLERDAETESDDEDGGLGGLGKALS